MIAELLFLFLVDLVLFFTSLRIRIRIIAAVLPGVSLLAALLPALSALTLAALAALTALVALLARLALLSGVRPVLLLLCHCAPPRCTAGISAVDRDTH